MSYQDSLETTVEQAVAATPARHVIHPRRAARLIEFCAVGATGVIVDLAITFALLGEIHYLLANVAGFAVAVTWNFGLNWTITFDKPEGSIPWQYGSYVALHAVTFGVRALALAIAVEAVGVPETLATIVGVGVAAVVNFVATERLFEGVDRVWLDLVDALNHAAHWVYSSRARAVLYATGLYHPLYSAYTAVLALLYRDDRRQLSVGRASAVVKTASSEELVSVLHTLEKEREQLEAFVAALESDDIVWDIGANVGVFSVLAGDVADEVVAIEAYAPTVPALERNLADNAVDGSVHTVALGAERGEVSLAVERDEIATQTPTVDGDGSDVQQLPGDVLAAPSPDVVKIDVEGAELEVLRGMQDTLADVRTVFVEAHDTADPIRYLLEGHGFEVSAAEATGQTYLRGDQR